MKLTFLVALRNIFLFCSGSETCFYVYFTYKKPASAKPEASPGRVSIFLSLTRGTTRVEVPRRTSSRFADNGSAPYIPTHSFSIHSVQYVCSGMFSCLLLPYDALSRRRQSLSLSHDTDNRFLHCFVGDYSMAGGGCQGVVVGFLGFRRGRGACVP